MRSNQRIAVRGGSLLDPLASLLPAGHPRHLQGASSMSDLKNIGATDRVLVLGAPQPCVDTFVVDILPRGRTLHSSERYDWIVSCT